MLHAMANILQGPRALTLASLPTQSFCMTVESRMMVSGSENFYLTFHMVFLQFFLVLFFIKSSISQQLVKSSFAKISLIPKFGI